MTTPTSGFPDWQQYASWRGVSLLNADIALAAGGSQTVLKTSVGNYASIRLILEGLGNGAEVQVFGGDSFSSPNQWLINRWVVRPDTVIRTVMPVLTSWIQIDVVSQAALGSTTRINVQPVNVAFDKLHYFGHQNILNVEARAIAAAATDLWYPTVLFGGPAHMWITTTPAPVDVVFNIETYNSDATRLDRIGQWRNVPGDSHFDLQLPAKSWRMNALNNTGAGQTYYFSIAPQGMLT